MTNPAVYRTAYSAMASVISIYETEESKPMVS